MITVVNMKLSILILIGLGITLSTNNMCPNDMVNVSGDYCSDLEEICINWLDSGENPLRCQEFKYPTVCKVKTQHMNFCIDKFEFPNVYNQKPKMQNTWYEAKSQCESLGKRLCLDTEWTQACRGPNNYPYPYGYKRNSSICRIDLPWQDPTTHSFEQLDKTVPSGSMTSCVSEYGIYDLTGNADEWVLSTGNSTYKSVLKGGHPHGVRNRCTPRTTAHNEDFSYYVTGFRCCKDSK